MGLRQAILAALARNNHDLAEHDRGTATGFSLARDASARIEAAIGRLRDDLAAQMDRGDRAVLEAAERYRLFGERLDGYHQDVKTALGQAITRLTKENGALAAANSALRGENLSLKAALLSVPGSGTAAAVPAGEPAPPVPPVPPDGTGAVVKRARTAGKSAAKGSGAEVS